eukprot:Pgem_evm1s20216
MMFSKIAAQIIAFNVVSTFALSIEQNQQVGNNIMAEAQHIKLERRGVWSEFEKDYEEIKTAFERGELEHEKALLERRVKDSKIAVEVKKFFDSKEFKNALKKGKDEGKWDSLKTILKAKTGDSDTIKAIKVDINNLLDDSYSYYSNSEKAEYIEERFIKEAEAYAKELGDSEKELKAVVAKIDSKLKETVKKLKERNDYFNSKEFKDALEKGKTKGEWDDLKKSLEKAVGTTDFKDFKKRIDDLLVNGYRHADFDTLDNAGKAKYITDHFVKATSAELKKAEDSLTGDAAAMGASIVFASAAILCQFMF